MNNVLSSKEARKIFEDNFPNIVEEVCSYIRDEARKGYTECIISIHDFDFSDTALEMLYMELKDLGYSVTLKKISNSKFDPLELLIDWE